MILTAKRPCIFNGHQYYCGDQIPEEDVLAPKLAEKRGLLSISPEAPDGASGPFYGETQVELPIIQENGSTVISVSSQSVSEAVRIMQLGQTDALAEIKDLQSNDTLIVLDLCTSNKTVRAAVRKRAEELSEKAEDEEAGDA